MKYALKKDGYKKLCSLIEHYKKIADENEMLAKGIYSDKPYDYFACMGKVQKCQKIRSHLYLIHDKVAKDPSAVFSDKELRSARLFFLDLKVQEPMLLEFVDKAFEKTHAPAAKSPLRLHSFEIHKEEHKDPVPRISASDSNIGDEEFSIFNSDAAPSRSATPK